MSVRMLSLTISAALVALACGCQSQTAPVDVSTDAASAQRPDVSYAARHIDDYATVRLSADLSHLSERQRQMIGVLVDAAQAIEPIFWQQVWGDRDTLLARAPDQVTRRFIEVNYGPWDRLGDDRPFVEGIGERPPGARFYPDDMTREEFEAADLPDKQGLYSVLRRDAQGRLNVVPYHVAFRTELEHAATLLRQAAGLAGDDGFRRYLELRAAALLDDDYQPSDFAWMEMKSNPVDIVIGPIETYQDALFGYKAAFEAYVLVKDLAWSERLSRFAKYLPELQRELPVDQRYKSESPGSDADLNAYDAVYYAGDANSGAKTIAINLPNDEQVQLEKGSRRLQLKNAMRAKFDRILLPIAEELIAPEQLAHVQFDAFFENVMFHEVAHGLGIKNTINERGTVREALKDTASSLEEGKADILGLYMIGKLAERGELDPTRLDDNYVTFLAGIFRSVRFGASSAHGQANMVAFNFLQQAGAFSRDEASGRYRVDFERMRAAVDTLSARILELQGNGDHAGATAMNTSLGVIGSELAGDLERLQSRAIPVDIVFEQGREVLGLPTRAR